MLEPYILSAVARELAKTSQIDPEWWDRYQSVETEICPKFVLLDMLETAPTAVARGVLYGKLVMRVEIENVTGCTII